MKLKFGFIFIILTTVALMILINMAINKISLYDNNDTLSKKPSDIISDEDLDDIDDDIDDEEEEKDVQTLLIKEKNIDKDTDKIIKVSNLTNEEINNELDHFENIINKENMIDKIDDPFLSAEQKDYLKEVLEEFVLLGLEQKRRKYMNLEPSLRDPLLAHKNSLNEIRLLLKN